MVYTYADVRAVSSMHEVAYFIDNIGRVILDLNGPEYPSHLS